jgi:hypothetical protein
VHYDQDHKIVQLVDQPYGKLIRGIEIKNPHQKKNADQNERTVSAQKQKDLHRKPFCEEQFKDVIPVQRIDRKQVEKHQSDIQDDAELQDEPEILVAEP